VESRWFKEAERAYQLVLTYLNLRALSLERNPLGDGVEKKSWRWILDEGIEDEGQIFTVHRLWSV
jgi:hypothetical protein